MDGLRLAIAGLIGERCVAVGEAVAGGQIDETFADQEVVEDLGITPGNIATSLVRIEPVRYVSELFPGQRNSGTLWSQRRLHARAPATMIQGRQQTLHANGPPLELREGDVDQWPGS